VITSAELDRWVRALATSSFYSLTHTKAPRGLASYPPNDSRCVAALTQASVTLSEGAVKYKPSESLAKCRQLAGSLRRDALSRLIGSAVLVGLDAEAGIRVSPGEVKQQLAKVESERFAKPGSLARYLADRAWSLPEELSEVEQELLSIKLRTTLLAKYSEAELVKYADEATKRWTARTICKPGLMVAECNGYNPATEGTTEAESTAVVMEHIGSLRKPKTAHEDLLCRNTPDGVKCHPRGKIIKLR
jgi:hypothetical protein